ncbi:hypothetical protein [Desulfosporosinus acididurans]|nr:hypothetical protein [Desulfosporosinus acididurans]
MCKSCGKVVEKCVEALLPVRTAKGVAGMETRKKVERLFKYYPEAKQNLEILKFQIGSYAGADEDEVIESLTYTVPEGERVSNSNISDKSSRIALIYKDIADHESQEQLQDMLKRYYLQKNELDVFEYSIKLLEPRLSRIITDIVINKMTWMEVSEKYYVSVNTVAEWRKKAIRQLTKMLESSLLFNRVV